MSTGCPPARSTGWWSSWACTSMSKDQVSRLCRGLDEQVRVFRERPLEGAYPYLWLDAKVERVREPGGVRHKALVIAYGVHESGRREVIGLDVGEAETESFWREFLRRLRARGLDGVKLAISDAHAGLEERDRARCLAAPGSAAPSTSCATCSATSAGRSSRWSRARSAGIFTATSAAEARARLGQVVDQLRAHAPKVARLLEDAEADLLAFYGFPAEHWPKLRSTNPLERVNREIGRRSDVVGIFPNDAALLRLAGMLLWSRTTSGWSGAATCRSPPWPWSWPPATRLAPPRPAQRRWPSSPRPEQTSHADDHQLHHEMRLDLPPPSPRIAGWASLAPSCWRAHCYRLAVDGRSMTSASRA